MQTRTRRSSQNAAETALPRTGAKKRGRPAKPTTGAKKRGRPSSSSAVKEEKPEQIVKKPPPPPRRRQPSRAQPLKKAGQQRTAGKKGSKAGNKVAPQSAISSSESAKGHETEMKMPEDKIKINRAPVLTMWVAVVATRQGYSFEEGLTFGKAIAGFMAQSKGRRLGLYEEPSEEKKEDRKRRRKEFDRFPVFGMNVPGKTTQEGLRLAIQSVQTGKPISPPSVSDYLHRSFGANYDRAKGAMEDLANSFPVDEVGKAAYPLYEKFRPTVPYGVQGWGRKGFLDVEEMRAMRRVA